MTSVTNIRLRVLPRFPSGITGTNGLTVVREGSGLVVKPDFGQLAEISNVPDSNETLFIAWNKETGEYNTISFQAAFDNSGNSRGYATKLAAEVATISASVHGIELYGRDVAGDGLGGLYIDTNNGSGDTFISGDGRTWYLAPDISLSRLDAGLTASVALADSSVQPTETAVFTGGAPYLLRYIREREANLLMFNPSLANGANVSAAMQAMMNAAAATGKPARIPVHPLGFTWRMNSGVTVPGCKVICDDGMNLETLNNIDLFTFTAHSVHWTGGNFEHRGDGKVFHTGEYEAHRFLKPQMTGHVTTALEPLILMLGSNTYLEEPSITTFRTNAFAVIVRKVAALININSRIEKAYMGGTGNGILVDSEQLDNRVEGLSIPDTKCVLTGGAQLLVRSVLDLTVTNGMWDRADGSCILLDATGLGIDGVDVSGNWLSAANNPTGVSGGAGIKSQPTGPIGNLNIINNRIRYCAYGIALTDNVSQVSISKNIITDIDQIAIGGAFDDWDIEGNSYQAVGTQLALTEGAGGGAVHINNERFSSSGAINLTVVTGARWNIGNTSGKKLRRRTSANTAASPTTGVYVNVPHGLIAAPRRGQILVEASFSSGAYSNIVANIAVIDATNVTVQLFFTTITNGVITVAVDASI
jgi:hypothetical protein